MKGHLFIVSDILVHDVRIGWQRQALMVDLVTRKIHPPIQMFVIPDVWLKRMTLSIASPAGHAPWHMLNHL